MYYLLEFLTVVGCVVALATILIVVTASAIVVIEGMRSALAMLSRTGASGHELLNGNIERLGGDRLRLARFPELKGR
jgi:hypothetical protein